MLKTIFNNLFSEKVEKEQNTSHEIIVKRLVKLGYEVKQYGNGNFDVVGNYKNHNKPFNRLTVNFEEEGILIKDELGFTLGSFPRILTRNQVCFVVTETVKLEQVS